MDNGRNPKSTWIQCSQASQVPFAHSLGPYSWLQGPPVVPQLWKGAQSWTSCFPHKPSAYIWTPVMNYVFFFFFVVTSLSHVQLSDPTDCSMPPVHGAHDAIQPSHPLLPRLLLPSVFPGIKLFSNESALHIRWRKYWSFSISSSLTQVYRSPPCHHQS